MYGNRRALAGAAALAVFLFAVLSPAPRASSSRSEGSLSPLATIVGLASYYGPGFHGRLTASGETFNMHALVAAHRTLPLGTVARVTNLSNGLSVVVRINDRGPYIRGRVLDLSKAAARALEFIRAGKARVKIDVLRWGDGDGYPDGGPLRPV